MQLPGPTLIVTEGSNRDRDAEEQPAEAAGNTSILFPGFKVSTTGGARGLLRPAQAANGATVTYTFVAETPGTYTYYSGTQGDLQVEMGLYGALIVLPSNIRRLATTRRTTSRVRLIAAMPHADFRLGKAAYNHASACYDREYLFQFSEIDPRIHRQVEEQVFADPQKAPPCARPTGCLVVETEPYLPAYFLINGRSMPDLMDPNYAMQYPHQPYNGNPHMHPGELTLLRIIGTGRWQHPFHEHGNHVRLLGARRQPAARRHQQARRTAAVHDHHDTRPDDGRHLPVDRQGPELGRVWARRRPEATCPHLRAERKRLLHVGTGCTELLRVVRRSHQAARGEAVRRKSAAAVRSRCPTPTSWRSARGMAAARTSARGNRSSSRRNADSAVRNGRQRPDRRPASAFMWHSHNEREITTNNAFPGGMMMMMVVDPWVFVIRRNELAEEMAMNSNVFKATLRMSRLATSLLLLRAVRRWRKAVTLSVGSTTTTLPDGQTVPMWGYACGTSRHAGCVGQRDLHRIERPRAIGHDVAAAADHRTRRPAADDHSGQQPEFRKAARSRPRS